jgi:hypothetical protein
MELIRELYYLSECPFCPTRRIARLVWLVAGIIYTRSTSAESCPRYHSAS